MKLCTSVEFVSASYLGKMSNIIVLHFSTGECQKCILDAASRYNAMKEQHEKCGKKGPGPEGDGVLIF